MKIQFLTSNISKTIIYIFNIIVWDEASMILKKALEIADQTLRDICYRNIPFGDNLIVLVGDFR